MSELQEEEMRKAGLIKGKNREAELSYEEQVDMQEVICNTRSA